MSFYDQFDEIKAEMRELYLNNPIPFLITTSFGKDSSLQLLLVWEMLLSVPKEQRTKKVYVISSDTLVELDAVSSYISKSLDLVEKKAKELSLPIEVRKVIPKINERYWWNVLGKGLPPVVPESRNFRWCTSKLKQRPINRVIRDIQKSAPIGMDQYYDMYLFLGTRDAESTQRKNSMEKFSIDGSKLGRHNEYDRICTYYPLKYIANDSVWAYLWDYKTLPWGMPRSTLESFYPDGVMECSVQSDQKASCGGNRNGCWTCTFVSEDKMLLEETKKGNISAFHLNEYKRLLAIMRNDLRYREPIKRNEQKKVHKRLGQQQEQAIFFSLFEDSDEEKQQHEYQSFQRAKDTEYSTGSFTFEARKLLLEHLLYTERITDLTLIGQDEVQSILDLWREEGFQVNCVQPKRFDYDGAVVVDEKFIPKEIETTNPYPQFWVTREFDCGRDDVIKKIRRIEQSTGKSFYYTLNHWDMGEDEEFVYNMANFLVCQKGVNSPGDAARVIDDWLYEKPRGWTWEAYSREMLLPCEVYQYKKS